MDLDNDDRNFKRRGKESKRKQELAGGGLGKPNAHWHPETCLRSGSLIWLGPLECRPLPSIHKHTPLPRGLNLLSDPPHLSPLTFLFFCSC